MKQQRIIKLIFIFIFLISYGFSRTINIPKDSWQYVSLGIDKTICVASLQTTYTSKCHQDYTIESIFAKDGIEYILTYNDAWMYWDSASEIKAYYKLNKLSSIGHLNGVLIRTNKEIDLELPNFATSSTTNAYDIYINGWKLLSSNVNQTMDEIRQKVEAKEKVHLKYVLVFRDGAWLQYSFDNSSGNTLSSINQGEVFWIYSEKQKAPTLEALTINLNDAVSIGSLIGTINVNDTGDSAITSFVMDGSELFSIDTNGDIRITSSIDTTKQATYSFRVYAINKAGASASVLVTVTTGTNLDSSSLDIDLLAVIFDDKQTSFDTNDDRVYIYFSDDIETRLSLESNLSQIFEYLVIPGQSSSWLAGNLSVSFDNSFFNRLSISEISEGALSENFSNNALIELNITNNTSQDLNATVQKLNVFSLLKTGQTNSEFANDDGALERSVNHDFSVNQNSVQDNMTNLTWTQSSTSANSYLTAVEDCDNLEQDSIFDWRVPTIDELISIANKGDSTTGVFTDFNSAYTYIWSSTEKNSTHGYIYDETAGITREIDKSYSSANVRCVSGEISQNESSFIRDNTHQIVLDTSSNLLWLDTNNIINLDLNITDAINYCENNVSIDGYTNWHLPNYNELFHLFQRSNQGFLLSDIFVNKGSGNYWTSTSFIYAAAEVYFIDSDTAKDNKTSDSNLMYKLRCVHDTP